MTVKRFEKKLDKVINKYRKTLEKRPIRYEIGEKIADRFRDRLWYMDVMRGLNVSESRIMFERLNEVREEFYAKV